MRKSLLSLMAAGTLITAAMAALPANAQSMCGPHEEMIKNLAGKYKEVRAGLGLAGDGNVVELYVGEDGSWTVLVTKPIGLTCMVAAGQDWQIMAPQFVEAGELKS